MIWILPASFALVAMAARTVSVEEKTNPSTVHTLMGNSGMGSRVSALTQPTLVSIPKVFPITAYSGTDDEYRNVDGFTSYFKLNDRGMASPTLALIPTGFPGISFTTRDEQDLIDDSKSESKVGNWAFKKPILVPIPKVFSGTFSDGDVESKTTDGIHNRSNRVDVATTDSVLVNPDTNDSLDMAIQEALPKFFAKGSYETKTKNFITTLERYLSDAKVTLINKRDNSNFTNLCSVGVFLCFRGACRCSGDIGPGSKRNFILDNETPFSRECPRNVARVCYREECYCQLHQNINSKRKLSTPILIATESTEESLASKSGYKNLWLYFLLVMMVSFILINNGYFY